MHYLKCNCLHCSGGIEFPVGSVGENVECPHCGKQTMLHSVAPNATKKKSSLILGITGAMIVLCATTVGLWKFLGSRNLKPRSATASLTSTNDGPDIAKSNAPTPAIVAQAGESQTLPSDLQKLKMQAEKGDSESQYTIGKHYLMEATNYSEARKWFQLAAEQNDPGGQNGLGLIYLNGLGMPIDYSQALNWFTKAAEQGFAKAELNLGGMYRKGSGVTQNYSEAFKHFRRAADAGLAIAQGEVGVMYWEGQGVPKNLSEALKWSARAAAQGEAVSQGNLGRFYRDGDGVPKDPVEAYKWFTLAALRGFKEAGEPRDVLAKTMTPEQIKEGQRRAAAFVKSTPTIEPSSECTEEITFDDPSKYFIVRIHRILLGQRAVDEGLIFDFALQAAHQQKKEMVYFEVSVSNMGARQEVELWPHNFILEDTRGNSYSAKLTKDELQGKIHLGKTGRGGVAFEIYRGDIPKKLIFDTKMVWQVPQFSSGVGLYYSNGEKIFAFADDLDELEIFSGKKTDVKVTLAKAEQGDVVAQRVLGSMYAMGRGVPKSDSEAMNWFRKAAERGDAASQYVLGLSYDVAKGVPEDYAEAFKWMNLAAAQNHKDAGRRREDLRSRMTREQLAESARRISIFTNSVAK